MGNNLAETIEIKDRSGVPAIIFGALAVALIIAFLSFRGSDVGQLPNLIGRIGGGPLLGGTGLVDSLAGAVIAFAIAVSWFGVGSFAVSFIKVFQRENQSRFLDLAMRTAIGAAIWSLIWFFLGLAGAYNGYTAAAALVAGLVLAGLNFRRLQTDKEETPVSKKASGFDRALIVLIAIPVVLAFITSLAPPTAKDTLLYHFAVPKAFITQGGSDFIAGNIASYLALGTEMHSVWAMLIGGFVSSRAAEAAAGAANFIFFPVLLLAICGWAREVNVERRWALIAVLIVAGVPTAYHVAASAYIDLALALYVTLAVYSLGRWWKSLENGWLIFAAVFLGAALSAKLTALFVIAAFALIILLRARQAKDDPDKLARIVLNGFGALILAGLIAAPWYLRTWQETGSPIFPFYMSVWKGEAAGWDTERSALFQQMNSQYGGIEKSPLDYLVAPFNLSVIAQPEQPVLFDGVLGIAFLFGLPILIWGLWKFEMPVEVKAGIGVAGIMYLFWLFSSQQLRYLLPILPVMAIGIAAAGKRKSEKDIGLRNVWQASLTAAAIAGILVSAAWFFEKSPLRVVLGGETKDHYLARNLDYYPYYQVLNTETPADSKVWLINMRRDTYNLDRPCISDYLFEDWTLRKMVWESRSASELKAKAAALGVQYVLVRHDFLFDYDRSTLVDDQKPRAENEAKLKIAKDFILDKANTVRADEKFSLVKLP
ncbi:MAG: glycosyltransferase family 39 protein [Saprospiraceae bacterium]|nr:glycosyltransferase family 39 protein [Pyrinomonadaceae bacterium]